MKFEEKVIHKIKVAIRDIRAGKLSPSNAGCAPFFESVKKSNLPMYEELIQDYKAAIIEYKAKNI